MSDLLLLGGIALLALSALLLVVALAATRPPRGAAIAFVFAIAAIAAAAWLSPTALSFASIGQAWANLRSGALMH